MLLNIFVQCVLISLVHSISEHPILIIVSYDAFRYNFIDTKFVPYMNRLRHKGTYADYLINVFPTKTFPNHHSIATGLYPGTHGVIGNSYFNPTKNEVVNISYEMFHYNEQIVPIWRKNEDLGQGRHSGVMMWPGGHYPYQGKNVTFMKEFQSGYNWFERIDTAISWIKDPSRPANLVMIYFEEPDTHAHAFGTNSPVVEDLLIKIDNITHYLEKKIEENKLTNRVNVIHLSDHGLTNVKPSNFINITQYLAPESYHMAGATPVLQITPKPGREDEVYQKLATVSVNEHFAVYKKGNFPAKWHYDNARSPPILIMADFGYGLDDLIIASKEYAKKYQFNLTDSTEFGVHGYDYTVKEMHPFFMARGPRIKINHKVAPFNTVDLYYLFCEILNLPPGPNNGTLANIKDILFKNNGKYSLTSIAIITVTGTVIALILIGCAAIITFMMIKRQQNITTVAALNKRFPQTFQTSIEAQHLLEPEEA